MKKEYNRMTTTDMPLDSSFTPTVEVVKDKKPAVQKPKINAIGKNTANKAKAGSKTTKTTSKSSTNSSSSKDVESKDKKLRTKLTKSDVELTDLEKLNDENIKQFRFKSKRNKVVIVLLSIMLAISITAISVYFAITKLETNCNMIAHGAAATFIVDNQEMDKFRAPANLQGNRVLILDIDIRIEEAGEFAIYFTPKAYQKGVEMDNVLIYEHNTDLFYDGGDGCYYSKNKIEGNQTISLCNGIILDNAYENTLNVDNFRLDFHVYFERV